MEASGRRWAVAGLGLVAIAAGVGCWQGSWWAAVHFVNPRPESAPGGPVPGFALIEWAGRVQTFQVAAVLLVVFGMIAWLLALNHWLWEGGRPAGDVRRDEGPKPRFVEPV